ncbi:MAG: DUF6537 domain-containing protein [Acetobacteraceae bacterium]
MASARSFHLAPPLITGLDPATGRRRKIAIPGRIALPLFRALRHGKLLRGTALDPFGWQAERRAERRLVRETERSIAAALDALRPGDAGHCRVAGGDFRCTSAATARSRTRRCRKPNRSVRRCWPR